MLGSPLGAVVGASDLAVTSAFLQGFELSVISSDDDQVELASAPRGRVRVVRAEAALPRTWNGGGLAALDFYSRSVQAPSVRIALGPLVMHQHRASGPDGLPVVVIEASHRRSSRLDTDDHATFSEAHSLVWVVPSIDKTAGFLRAAGMTMAFDFPIEDPAVSEITGLPVHRPVRMAMLGDGELSPMRLELLEIPGAGTTAHDGIARAGGAWPWFEVEDLASALTLPWTAIEHLSATRVRCVAPGGLIVELSA